MAPTRRLGSVDALRGLAALSVCWYHLTHGTPSFLSNGWLKSSGAYGWTGVEAFFVISGFVIPLSLHRRGYSVSGFGTFLARRIARVDPPYFASLLLSLFLAWVSTRVPGYRGAPFHVSPFQIALHVGYLNDVFHQPWLNPVYWTLAIEFQFYLVLGLAFPLVASSNSSVRTAAFVAIATASIALGSYAKLLGYAPLFLIGLATFHQSVGNIDRRAWLAWIVVLAGIAGWVSGPVVGAVGLAAALFIVFVKRTHAVLEWLGAISYSLYLVHVPIGGRAINLAERLTKNMGARSLLLFAALAVCLVASWIFHHMIELPAVRWSERIDRKSPPVAPQRDEAAASSHV